MGGSPTVLMHRSAIVRSSLSSRAAAFLFAVVVVGGARSEDLPELCGPYLGQTPPSAGAEVFLPEALKPPEGFHSSVVFNNAGDKACWTEMALGRTWCSAAADGCWAPPAIIGFDPEFGVREPMFADDDRRFYYISRRPLEHDPVNRERIWFVERLDSGWSAPRVIDDAVSSHPTHWQFSLTAAGDLYFTSEIVGVRGGQDIFVARSRDGVFSEPESVGGGVNSDLRDFCPFVAPDESYLIFARSVPEERGRSDLFISFRDDDGAWTGAVNMGETVNSLANEVSPVVTPDGRYLVFLRAGSDMNDVYWIGAGIIDDLKTEALQDRRDPPVS